MKRLLVILILIILFGFSGETLRTAGAVPVQPPSTTVSYLPLVISRPCPENNPKANIALAYWERGIAHDLLCIPKDNLYHNWGWSYAEDDKGIKTPMVWSRFKNGFDYVKAFRQYTEQWEAENEQAATWFVLFANEPDRPDQAWLSPSEVALLYMELTEVCPGCRFVGPMYSAADSGILVKEVWRLCAEMGCDMGQLYAHSLHIYPRPDDNYGPAWRVREFCKIVEGEDDCSRPIWITEMGYRTCWPAVYKVFKSWVIEAVLHPGIEQIFVYSGFQSPQNTCHFYGMLSWDKWELFGINQIEPMGRAWRDGLIEAGYR